MVSCGNEIAPTPGEWKGSYVTCGIGSVLLSRGVA
jgi:hypothetical protein